MHPPSADPIILEALKALFAKADRRRITIEALIRVVPDSRTMEGERDLLCALEYLEAQGALKLPSKKGKGWQAFGILPRYVTLVLAGEDRTRRTRKTELARLREETPWEPSKMAAFASSLKTKSQLEQAVAVNRYLLNRRENPAAIPHRERALEVFGREKALDSYVHKGLFAGRITLEDLDCFYCPEPLPYELFSRDPETTCGRPLLLVENSATYWSCCSANRADHPLGGGFFAAVVFGKGFKASRSTPIQSLDSLNRIEVQARARAILYFGDLDPAGLAIPEKINETREKNGRSSLLPALGLYRALVEKDLTTGYDKSQKALHNAQWASQWLGPDLAAPYLERCATLRWPQEGLTAEDIARALAGSRNWS